MRDFGSADGLLMRFSKPSPAMMVALLALFVALGGSSYAAIKLPKASVGPKQLKKNSVTSPKVKAGSLLLSDFKRSQRARLRGPQGLQGAQGAKGAQGVQGVPGQDATNLFAYVRDTGGGTAATLEYEQGATAMSDPAGENNFVSPYRVTFDRNLDNCVAHVTTGQGRPSGSAGFIASFPIAVIQDAGVVSVALFEVVGGATTGRDESFMLSVLC
jgi:hypothetical protein